MSGWSAIDGAEQNELQLMRSAPRDMLTRALAAIAVPLSLAAVATEDADAVREAAFREALRVVKDERPLSPLRCLAVENGLDPPRRMLDRLAKESGLVLHPYSVCAREGLLPPHAGSLDGPKDLIAVESVKWRSKGRADVNLRLLGGTGIIAVRKEKIGWNGACCLGGIIGQTSHRTGWAIECNRIARRRAPRNDEL